MLRERLNYEDNSKINSQKQYLAVCAIIKNSNFCTTLMQGCF